MVVEDGTGLDTADSYIDAAYALAYHTARGTKDAWTEFGSSEREQALIRATDYVDGQNIFLGAKKVAAQALSWPRTGVIDTVEGVAVPDDVVPAAVKRVVADIALKSLQSSLSSMFEDPDAGGKVKSQTVGPVSITYQDGVSITKTYGVMSLLKGLIRPADPMFGVEPISTQSDRDPYFEHDQFDIQGG